MATLVVDDGFDLAASAPIWPSVCRPTRGRSFCGWRPAWTTTETFKTRKQAMIDEGFDPGRVADPLYFDDRAEGRL